MCQDNIGSRHSENKRHKYIEMIVNTQMIQVLSDLLKNSCKVLRVFIQDPFSTISYVVEQNVGQWGCWDAVLLELIEILLCLHSCRSHRPLFLGCIRKLKIKCDIRLNFLPTFCTTIPYPLLLSRVKHVLAVSHPEALNPQAIQRLSSTRLHFSRACSFGKSISPGPENVLEWSPVRA